MTVPSDWIEFAGDAAQSPGNFACEYNQSHAQMVYDIPFGYFSPSAGQSLPSMTTVFSNNATNAVGFILGYSDVDLDGNLFRYLPLQHPYLAGLYASKILSAIPMAHGFRNEDGGPVDPPQYFAASSVDPGTEYAVWDFVRVTIYYQTFPYIIINDHAIAQPPYNGKEQFRYTLPKFEGGIRSLNFGRKGQARWAEGQDGPVVGPPAVQGQIITSLQPVKNESYADITWMWYRIPARGIFQFVNGLPCLPTNIAAITGTVNDSDWPGPGGYPRGTLLCMPPKFHEETYPLSPAALGLFGNQLNDLPVMYNVEFRFKYYDPQPLDPASPPPLAPTPAAISRGHNVAATRRGTYALWNLLYNGVSQTMYSYSNFDTLFELLAPT